MVRNAPESTLDISLVGPNMRCEVVDASSAIKKITQLTGKYGKTNALM
jgi:hypothetical protein